MFQPEPGQTEIEVADERWTPVACSYHDGREVIDHEVVGVRAGEQINVPVLSERVGFQPECEACALALADTLAHLRMVHGQRDTLGELAGAGLL